MLTHLAFLKAGRVCYGRAASLAAAPRCDHNPSLTCRGLWVNAEDLAEKERKLTVCATEAASLPLL
jgi:hypothetical protein